jgi:hypothetical protein
MIGWPTPSEISIDSAIPSTADSSTSSAFLADSASTETFQTSASPVQPM